MLPFVEELTWTHKEPHANTHAMKSSLVACIYSTKKINHMYYHVNKVIYRALLKHEQYQQL